LTCQFREYLVEYAHPAPPDEPVIDRLVGTVLAWGVTPSQPILDDKYNTTYHHAVIYPRNPMREGEIRLNAAHLRFAQKEQVRHRHASQT
jgi:hypothetical protein